MRTYIRGGGGGDTVPWDWEANRYLVSAEGDLIELDEVYDGQIKVFANGGIACFEEKTLKRLIRSGDLKAVSEEEFQKLVGKE